MKYTIGLDTEQISNLIDNLKSYNENLKIQCIAFVTKLAESGIKTAKANCGKWGEYIVFKKEVEGTDDGCIGIMYAYDGEKVISSWKYKGSTKSVEVSPLLMAEFGSGWKAKVLDDVEGVGQGTFPGETHAFDPRGWWWETPDGVKHHSTGEAPTFPMHSASLDMVFKIEEIAKEVFGG